MIAAKPTAKRPPARKSSAASGQGLLQNAPTFMSRAIDAYTLADKTIKSDAAMVAGKVSTAKTVARAPSLNSGELDLS